MKTVHELIAVVLTAVVQCLINPVHRGLENMPIEPIWGKMRGRF
jgi:hypothetical protein